MIHFSFLSSSSILSPPSSITLLHCSFSLSHLSSHPPGREVLASGARAIALEGKKTENLSVATVKRRLWSCCLGEALGGWGLTLCQAKVYAVGKRLRTRELAVEEAETHGQRQGGSLDRARKRKSGERDSGPKPKERNQRRCSTPARAGLMGSEAVEDCVQGALASLYPPFESTAPPLLSQAQYVGCLFLHSGWPLCLGDRVVVQLSTLDWRLLRSTDFYLQVVPFSTRCPRLALKCLAPGGRNVQEVLVPEAQHPLVFTPEWLHSINKERGFQREGGGGLDTCLVSTCEGVVRLPWQEVVYPTFVSSPGDPSPSPSPPLEADSWSWDEDDGPSPGRERGAEPGGEYVELLESRDGPEGVAGGVVEGVASMGGAVSRQRYLEMHGICKTKTLPLCRRGRGLRLRRGRAWAHSKHDTLGGSRRGGATARRDSPPAAAPPHTTPHHFLSRPVPRVIDLERDRGSLAQERRPGVGREREGAGDPTPDQPANQEADHFLGHEGEGQSDEEELCHSDSPLDQSERLLPRGAGRGNADHPLAALTGGSENADHPLAALARSSENADHPLAALARGSENADCRLAALAGGSESAERAVDRAHETLSSQNDTELQTEGSATDGLLTQPEHATDLSPAHSTELEHSGMLEDALCLGGKEVKTTGFRAHSQSEQAQPQVEKEEPTQANEGTEEEESRQKVGENLKDQSQISPEALSQSGISLSDHCAKEALPVVSPDQSECSSCKTPPLLRELDPEVLQSGWLILTGTVDRMGRALVFTESHIPSEGYHDEELARQRDDPGSGQQAGPSLHTVHLHPKHLSAEQQDCAQISLAGVEVHTVCGTGVLQQFVDKQQLPTSMGGDFQHCHSAWLTYRLSLEQLTERCKSALSLLEEALHSLNTEALPRCTKAVSLSVDKHRQLMMSVLADQRLTELQRVGGAWLAGLTNGGAGLAQRSPDCRAALARTSDLYNSVDDALHRLVRESNQRGRGLDALSRLAKLEEKLDQSWEGLAAVLDRLPSIRDKLRNMSHSLSDCWSQLHTTLRLLSTLTEASQWCDAVCVTPLPPASSSPLTSLPPIPPSRFHDARALALELGGGALLELWSQTLERYQQTLAQFKSRLLQAERAQAPPQAPPPAQGIPRPKAASSSSMCDLLTLQGAPDWEAETNLQAWGSLASLFRPQTCSTLKIGEEKKREGVKEGSREGTREGGGGGGGGKFLQALLHPAKKSPPRRRHPSFDLQALLGPRRAAPAPRPAEGPPGPSRGSPLSWLGRRALGDTVLSTSVAAAMPGGAQPGGGHAGGGVLIRGVEVSSKEVVDHTGSPRQHLCTRLLGSERQYVALLKAVEEHYLPLMDSVDTPPALRGQTDALFSNWSSLTSFHVQLLLPALEGAMAQTLLLQDCFNKYEKLAGLATPSFPECLQAPFQQLSSYCEALEELASLTPTSDSVLSTLRQAQQQGEDLRASDLIIGCPGDLLLCGGVRRKKTGLRRVFLYQQVLIFTKSKTLSPARTVYSYKHCVKASRTRDCLTLQAQSSEEKAEWTHHIAQLLWTHAIHNTVHSSSDSSSVGSQKEGSSPTSGRHSQKTQLSLSLHCSVNFTSITDTEPEHTLPQGVEYPRTSILALTDTGTWHPTDIHFGSD
ncbi:hypothetical protein JZ751_019539 [Albula glossodonta]|uniref:DH domain-containing protein n=1 Tax=Albula glossodonta TaxID=121402 RepID=A0A8T2MVQ5_9TELE|nr:hypothetical protein JZ751_019539 [Albula glossodonta]